MQSLTKLTSSAVWAVLACAGAAFAEQGPSPAASLRGEAAELLTSEEMQGLAGGTGVEVHVVTEGTLGAVNSGNSVNGDVVGSGQIDIGANAFAGYSGLGNFVINSGHNNNLQSSMNVSIVLAPPGP
jgi:hypothetical protein